MWVLFDEEVNGLDVDWLLRVSGDDRSDAAMSGHLEVCELLVAGGAEVGAVNEKNETAAALAMQERHVDVAAYLELQLSTRPAGER